tara:strand:+ start:213 stop:464 length:252 start_codon:yes stop_codon:yes gene_type:complete
MSVPKYVMHVKNLFAGYGETEILHGVDINISDGEIVCIIGPNGAGKSTVLKAILGQINVTQGSIHLSEEDILSIPTSQIIKKG